jgi:hypothetical protein
MAAFADPVALYQALRDRGWSAATVSAGYDPARRARNQCSVTALAVQTMFGGDIVKTPTVGGTHFYNHVDGVYWDLTVEQFDAPIPFANLPSSRDEALADSSPAKLEALLAAVTVQDRDRGGA